MTIDNIKKISRFLGCLESSLSDILRFKGKAYKCTGKQGCGSGEIYTFREILHENGTEKLSDTCRMFQVYPNGVEPAITPYNQSEFLIPSFRQFLKSKGI